MKEHWVHVGKKKEKSFISTGRKVKCKYYTEICLTYFIYEIHISQSGDDIATDHSHRLLLEYLCFKPMGIVFYLASYKNVLFENCHMACKNVVY